MSMQLISGKDCQLFKFWWESAIHTGIQYQAEMFIQFQTLPVQKMAQAYEMASQLDDAGAQIILVKTSTHYLLGVALSDPQWVHKLQQLQTIWMEPKSSLVSLAA